MLTAGIDLGAAALKIAICDGPETLWARAVPTTPASIRGLPDALRTGLGEMALDAAALQGIAATGYGRNMMPNADVIVDEISANAAGAFALSRGAARTVINIGGQDVKIIKLAPDGRPVDFRMNDKCAAGTGRFFEMAARILQLPLERFGEAAERSRCDLVLNSTCAVFAETEIVSLLYSGTESSDIVRALHRSVARRVADLAGEMDLEPDAYLDGGLGSNRGLGLVLEEELDTRLFALPRPQFTVAVGAALLLAHGKCPAPRRDPADGGPCEAT